MRFTLRLDGTTPLLMHNPRMVDPEFELVRAMSAITSKRKKTDEDRRQMMMLEWYGGLFEENGVVVQPTSKVRKCLINAAKMQKLGKAVERTVSFAAVTVPLIHDGPKTIDALFADMRFHSRLSVGVDNKRVMRVRPKFPTWSMELTGLFVEDAGLNWDQFEHIASMAGVVEGIGDNRVNGYGRFTATLTGDK